MHAELTGQEQTHSKLLSMMQLGSVDLSSVLLHVTRRIGVRGLHQFVLVG